MLWFSLVNLPVKTIDKSIKMHVVELRVESRELRAESCRELPRVAASCDLIVESFKSNFEVRVMEN